MAWLRVDDGFPHHPKLTGLSRAERWTWLELMCHCARYKTEGLIPCSIREALPRVTPAFRDKCVRLGLIDRTDAPEDWIHDWSIYNGGTVTDRVAAFVADNPEATANDVVRGVHGQRKLVLAELRKIRGEAA